MEQRSEPCRPRSRDYSRCSASSDTLAGALAFAFAFVFAFADLFVFFLSAAMAHLTDLISCSGRVYLARCGQGKPANGRGRGRSCSTPTDSAHATAHQSQWSSRRRNIGAELPLRDNASEIVVARDPEQPLTVLLDMIAIQHALSALQYNGAQSELPLD